MPISSDPSSDLVIKTPRGPRLISAAKLRELRQNGKITDDAKVVSVDRGATWLTFREVEGRLVTEDVVDVTDEELEPPRAPAAPPKPALRSDQVACPICQHVVSARATQCPQCGEPMRTKRAVALGEDDEVSILWTLLFGCFYLFYKGWVKSGFVAFIMAFCTGGISWLILPFFMETIVNKLDRR